MHKHREDLNRRPTKKKESVTILCATDAGLHEG